MSCNVAKQLIEKTIAFHGHSCPGVHIGIRVAELAMQRLGRPEGEDWVAVVETDMCGVDAIQYLTGCTFGKGNLIHRDFGKKAFSFYNRKTGNGFRALLAQKIQDDDGVKLGELRRKVFSDTATEDERAQYKQLREVKQKRYMQASLEDMFIVTDKTLPAPRPAVILQSLACDACHEMTMESRTRRFDGKTLCIPCFERVEQKI